MRTLGGHPSGEWASLIRLLRLFSGHFKLSSISKETHLMSTYRHECACDLRTSDLTVVVTHIHVNYSASELS